MLKAKPLETSVAAIPPRRDERSKSVTGRPARAMYAAAVSPASPPPMMTVGFVVVASIRMPPLLAERRDERAPGSVTGR